MLCMHEVLGRRKHPRHRLSLPIQISWHDENAAGEAYVDGNSVDVSNYGMAVELPTCIPLSTPVKLKIEGVDVLTVAIVRNVREIPGGSFWIGLEFRRTLLGEPLPTIHQALLRSVIPPSKSPTQSINLRRGRRVLKRIVNIRCLFMDHDFGWGRDVDGNLTLDCMRCQSSVPVNFG
jgi:PilZ domain